MMGGIFGGAIAMPGPPFVTFVTLSPWTMDSMRGVLQAYMIFVYILFLTIFGAAELMEKEILLMDLYHLPSVILGMVAGQAFFKRIPKQWFLRGVWVLLTVVGLKLIF